MRCIFWCIHPPHLSKNKTTQSGGYIFWWEWVDSNHLSRKTTDLQSAPALQLRRTPKTFAHFRPGEMWPATRSLWRSVVRAAGIEPAFQAWKACILAFVLCPLNSKAHQLYLKKSQTQVFSTFLSVENTSHHHFDNNSNPNPPGQYMFRPHNNHRHQDLFHHHITKNLF